MDYEKRWRRYDLAADSGRVAAEHEMSEQRSGHIRACTTSARYRRDTRASSASAHQGDIRAGRSSAHHYLQVAPGGVP